MKTVAVDKIIKQLHIGLMASINVLGVLFFVYMIWQGANYYGDGLGNLPDNAPEWLRSFKQNLCFLNFLCHLLVVVWVAFALYDLIYSSLKRRLWVGALSILTLIIYSIGGFLAGSYICW